MHLPTVVYVAGRAGVLFEQTAISNRGEKRQKCQEYGHNGWLALNQLEYVSEVAECRVNSEGTKAASVNVYSVYYIRAYTHIVAGNANPHVLFKHRSD